MVLPQPAVPYHVLPLALFAPVLSRWSWGNSNPIGTVKEVIDDTAEVKTKRGNTVKKDGAKENPAVVIDTGNSDAVKKVSRPLGYEARRDKFPSHPHPTTSCTIKR